MSVQAGWDGPFIPDSCLEHVCISLDFPKKRKANFISAVATCREEENQEDPVVGKEVKTLLPSLSVGPG